MLVLIWFYGISTLAIYIYIYINNGFLSAFCCIFDFVCILSHFQFSISFHLLNCLMNVVINFKKPQVAEQYFSWIKYIYNIYLSIIIIIYIYIFINYHYYIYIYIYIYSHPQRLFCCITTLQCG